MEPLANESFDLIDFARHAGSHSTFRWKAHTMAKGCVRLLSSLDVVLPLFSGNKWGLSNYPPAKPGALRLLAPQRGLIAIGQNQNRKPFVVDSVAKVLVVVIPAKAGIQFSLDSGSRFTCP
jgi:hypothetical protein